MSKTIYRKLKNLKKHWHFFEECHCSLFIFKHAVFEYLGNLYAGMLLVLILEEKHLHKEAKIIARMVSSKCVFLGRGSFSFSIKIDLKKTKLKNVPWLCG